MIKKIDSLILMRRKALAATFIALSWSTVKSFNLNNKKYDELYDLAVIGGGSAGLATAF